MITLINFTATLTLHSPRFGQDAAVALFAEKLLSEFELGYAEGRRITTIRQGLPLVICGVHRSAQADVCVVDTMAFLFSWSTQPSISMIPSHRYRSGNHSLPAHQPRPQRTAPHPHIRRNHVPPRSPCEKRPPSST
jgi:hypothetical protein